MFETQTKTRLGQFGRGLDTDKDKKDERDWDVDKDNDQVGTRSKTRKMKEKRMWTKIKARLGHGQRQDWNRLDKIGTRTKTR